MFNFVFFLDPNYVKMGTTETELRLTDLQTPGPNKEMDLMGEETFSLVG